MTINLSLISGVLVVLARWLFISTALLTLFTFGFAITAVPVAGQLCTANCIEYPYLDILNNFPKDYLWMYPAMILCLVFVAVQAVIYLAAVPDRKFFGLIGLCFGLMAAAMGAAAMVFTGPNLAERIVRWVFPSAPVLCVIAHAYESFQYGIQREYVFEIIAISIDWIALTIGLIALSFAFRAQTDRV